MSASLSSGTYPRAARRSLAPIGIGAVLRSAGRSVWALLHSIGARRAQGHLMQLARQHQLSNPALSRQLRHAARDMMNS